MSTEPKTGSIEPRDDAWFLEIWEQWTPEQRSEAGTVGNDRNWAIDYSTESLVALRRIHDRWMAVPGIGLDRAKRSADAEFHDYLAAKHAAERAERDARTALSDSEKK